MFVKNLIQQLMECPMEANVSCSVPGETELRNTILVGIIPEGPLGIYKPKQVYIEISEKAFKGSGVD